MASVIPEGDLTRFRIGIVGHGFVGQAVEYAFTHPLVDFNYYDPRYETSVDSLADIPAERHPRRFSKFKYSRSFGH